MFEFLNGVWSEIQPSDREGLFRKSSFEFLERLASALNTNASQSRKESVHKIARHELEGFNQLLKIYLSSATDTDLCEDEILDSLALLSWYMQRFWKSLLRNIFSATKLITEAYPQIIPRLPETLHYIYDTILFR